MAYRKILKNLNHTWIMAFSLFLCLSSQAKNIEELEALLKTKPDSIKIKSYLAKKYLTAGEYSKCSKLLLPISDEIKKTYLYVLSQCLHQEKNIVEEIKILNQIALLDKKDYRAHFLLGKTLALNNENNEAIKSLRTSLKINPKYLHTYQELLEIFKKADNKYEQRILYKTMSLEFGEKSTYLNELCRLFYLDSYYEQAISYCQKATQKDKTFPDNMIYLGKSYQGSGEDKRSKKILIYAAKKFKSSEFSQWSAGELFFGLENYHVALKYFKNGINSNPESARSFAGIALSSFALKDYKLAYNSFKSACKLEPKYYFEFRKAASKLRQERNYDWQGKYFSASNSCRTRFKLK